MVTAAGVGFVGLGQMGSGMATNLIAHLRPQGAPLVLFDLCRAACERVAAPVRVSPAVVDVASGMEDLAAQCQLILLCLPDGVGGCKQNLEEARPVLETFTSKIVHMGASGNGQLAKAMNNCLYNISCAATAEMLSFAAKAELPLEEFMEVVSSGTGQSFGFDQWAPHILQRQFEAPKYGFPMGSAFKDFETLNAAVLQQGLDLPPVLAAAEATYREALAQGLGDQHKGPVRAIIDRIIKGPKAIDDLEFQFFKLRTVEGSPVPSKAAPWQDMLKGSFLELPELVFEGPRPCLDVDFRLHFEDFPFVAVKENRDMRAKNFSPAGALQIFQRAVQLFWRCHECRVRFEAYKLDEDEVKAPCQASLWLWSVHNAINGRLLIPY
eukprot:g23537.t1